MDNKLLTIVIPTYNMEKYLHRCLDSLILPSKLMGQLEVLVVNDGSTDASSDIAHEYQQEFPNTFRVIDKENGHYGSCVNRGLQEAHGIFLRLLDADDCFNNGQLRLLLGALSTMQDEVDVVITNVYTHSEDSVKLTRMRGAEYGRIYDFGTFDFAKPGNEFLLGVQAVTYRKSLLEEINLRLQTGICYTDCEYGFYPLTKARKFVFLDINLFNYFLGREGQSMSRVQIEKNFTHFYKIGKRILGDYLQLPNTMEENRRKSLQHFIYNATYWMYAYCLLYNREPDRQRKDMLKEVDKLVCQDASLKGKMDALKYKHVPFIKVWHEVGIRPLVYMSGQTHRGGVKRHSQQSSTIFIALPVAERRAA